MHTMQVLLLVGLPDVWIRPANAEFMATAFFLLDYGFPNLVFLKDRKKIAHQFPCVVFSNPTTFQKVFSIISQEICPKI